MLFTTVFPESRRAAIAIAVHTIRDLAGNSAHAQEQQELTLCGEFHRARVRGTCELGGVHTGAKAGGSLRWETSRQCEPQSWQKETQADCVGGVGSGEKVGPG